MYFIYVHLARNGNDAREHCNKPVLPFGISPVYLYQFACPKLELEYYNAQYGIVIAQENVTTWVKPPLNFPPIL